MLKFLVAGYSKIHLTVESVWCFETYALSHFCYSVKVSSCFAFYVYKFPYNKWIWNYDMWALSSHGSTRLLFGETNLSRMSSTLSFLAVVISIMNSDIFSHLYFCIGSDWWIIFCSLLFKMTMMIPAWIINCLILNLPRSLSERSSSPRVVILVHGGCYFY